MQARRPALRRARDALGLGLSVGFRGVRAVTLHRVADLDGRKKARAKRAAGRMGATAT